jgi:hemoglobin/transferrin/lactoferrin receptor protein
MRTLLTRWILIGAWIQLYGALAGAGGRTASCVPSDSLVYRLSEISVTAFRYEKNVFETSLPVQTISSEGFSGKGLSQPGDLASLAVGAASLSTGPWSSKWIIRGLSGSRVLVLVDGLRLTVFRGYGEHPPLLDLDLVERAEVVRGPASVLYGSDAAAGVVNLITRRPFPRRDAPLSAEMGVRYSSAGNQWTETLSLEKIRLPSRGFLRLVRRKAGNMRTPTGVLEHSSFDSWTIAAEGERRLASGGAILARIDADRMRDAGIPMDPYAEEARFKVYDRTRAVVSVAGRLSESPASGTRLDAYVQKEKRQFSARIAGKPKGKVYSDQVLEGNRDVFASGLDFQVAWPLARAVVMAGGEAFIQDMRSERFADAVLRDASGKTVADPPPDAAPPLPKTVFSGAALFISADFPWGRSMSFLAGFRSDAFRSSATGTKGTLVEETTSRVEKNWSGQAGWLLRMGPGLRLYANAGRGFRAPAPEERYFLGPGQTGTIIGNPSLRSETSLNTDGGIKWDKAGFSGEAGVFRNRVENLIVLRTVGALRDTLAYENVGAANLHGFELRMARRFGESASAFGETAWVSGKDTGTNAPLPWMPPWIGRVGLSWRDGETGMEADCSVRFIGARRKGAQNELPTSPYALVEAGVSRAFGRTRKIVFSAAVRNLFNIRYQDPLSMVTWQYGPGRDVSAGLRWTP